MKPGPQVLCLNNRKAPGMMGFHPRVSQERFISVSKVNPSLSGCGPTGLIMMVPTFWIWANSNIFVLIWVRGPRSRERGKQKVEFFCEPKCWLLDIAGNMEWCMYIYIYVQWTWRDVCFRKTSMMTYWISTEISAQSRWVRRAAQLPGQLEILLLSFSWQMGCWKGDAKKQYLQMSLGFIGHGRNICLKVFSLCHILWTWRIGYKLDDFAHPTVDMIFSQLQFCC